jgi:HSP20 family protein
MAFSLIVDFLKKRRNIMTHIIKKANSQPASFGSVVDQIFQNNLGRFFDDNAWGFNGIQTGRQVPVNIRETDKSYELEVIAPGLKKQDFQISLANDLLTISFQKKEDNASETKNNRWLHKEYDNQAFNRSFTLNNTVDGTRASARYEEGVLFVSLPKKEEAQQLSRNIEIQ